MTTDVISVICYGPCWLFVGCDRRCDDRARPRLDNRSPAELAGQPVRTVACPGSSHRGVGEHVEAMHSACVDMQFGGPSRPAQPRGEIDRLVTQTVGGADADESRWQTA